MNRAWTTSIGAELQRMQSEGATDQELYALEDRLRRAFNCVKHVRKCYNKPATQVHAPDNYDQSKA